MEKEEIFRVIQEYTSNPPLILAGTGLTIPVGIPGMWALADYLREQLDEKYKTNTSWISVSDKIASGIDLETALSEDKLSVDLLNDIKKCTWELVNAADIKYFREKHLFGRKAPFIKILSKFLKVTGRHLDIITTNYDRYIEYCCDQYGIEIDNGYKGIYTKSSDMSFSKRKNNVTLLKVHGSLDTFKDNLTNESISIPIQDSIPRGFTPDIITPGISKYEAILTNASRQLVHHADTVINKATNFLCIGYGFNDSQIQELMIKKIKSGCPIVVVTKELTDNALGIINNNSERHAVILDGEDGKTRFIVNKTDVTIDGTYWTIDGFNEII
ncbi:MAG: SIR2 family protein [Ruminococcus sp.]|uniref:SIR2 family protein n=1 Tax=Ruminococcus sp. TaxID=41978 RepID=UPI0028736BEE|nr:SIR2 family protein [Ruminococcus sp.]MBQ3284285.1 SIR2 family protein [Ruminococcus sp.]